MFNLIFVDDEFIIREGISKRVDWGNNGFKLCGMFDNGEKALDYINNNKVDIVITDINMPKMNGLELSKILSRDFPDIMVLLLSGYDDFEYAREALKNHVREFLLKPITAEELKTTLSTIYKELNSLKEHFKKQDEIEDKLKQSFPLLKERFFNKLLKGNFTEEIYKNRSEYFNWCDLGGFYQISVIGIPDIWNELERLSLQEHIKESIEVCNETFFDSNEDLVILVQGQTKEITETETTNIINHNLNFKTSRDNNQLVGGCGDIVNSFTEFNESYTGALTALDYIKVFGLSRVLFIKDVRDDKRVVPEVFNKHLSEVIHNLKESHKKGSIDAIDALFNYLKAHYLTKDEAKQYFNRVYSNLETFSGELGFSLEISDNFIDFTNIERVRNYFKEYIIELEGRISLRRNDVIVSRIDRAKEIISTRYKEFNFSLQDICDELYLSVSQFSFLFKEGTGKTFVEFLTNYRIEEAKKILKTTDYKVYEVAESVGYQDPRYFSIIFKKLTGYTALEYRKSLEK